MDAGSALPPYPKDAFEKVKAAVLKCIQTAIDQRSPDERQEIEERLQGILGSISAATDQQELYTNLLAILDALHDKTKFHLFASRLSFCFEQTGAEIKASPLATNPKMDGSNYWWYTYGEMLERIAKVYLNWSVRDTRVY